MCYRLRVQKSALALTNTGSSLSCTMHLLPRETRGSNKYIPVCKHPAGPKMWTKPFLQRSRFFFFVFFLILALRMTDNPQQGSRRLWSDSSRNWEDRQYILALKVILAWENPHVQWNSILKTQQKNYIRPAKGHPISHTAEILTYLVWINTVFAETLVGLGFL